MVMSILRAVISKSMVLANDLRERQLDNLLLYCTIGHTGVIKVQEHLLAMLAYASTGR